MLREKRKYKRLDLSVIVEFKAMKDSAAPYLGITRDFAYDGFSFESQEIESGPGENLKFIFKHSQRDLYVSALGVIVWKKQTSEYGYLIGIKIKEIFEATRKKMLEIVSAIGNISSDYFDPGGNDSDGPAPGREESAASVPLIPDDDINVSIADSGAHVTPVSAGWKARDENSSPVKRVRKRGAAIPFAKIIIVLIAVFAVSGIIDYTQSPLENHVTGNAKQTTPPVVIEKTTTPAADLTPVRSGAYQVQVGAWKNRVYSDEVLPKVRKSYPDAYVVVENNFNIIRIPWVKTRDEGSTIIKDIKDGLGFDGILITQKYVKK